MDLFTDNQIGRCCVHIATDTVCIIKKVEWYKGQLDYSVLVPQNDNKGKTIFCDATYSQTEIVLLEIWV